MNDDELAKSIREIYAKHDKLETDCKQTLLAVELVALQMKVQLLEKQVQQLVCCLQSIAKCIVVPDHDCPVARDRQGRKGAEGR